MSPVPLSLKRMFVVSVVLVGFLLGTFLPAGPGQAASIALVLEGPTVLAKGSKTEYALTITGGPGAFPGGEFSYTAKLLGKNLTGSSVTPSTAKSSDGLFRFNLTAPSATGEVTLQLVAASTLGGNSEELQRESEIDIVTPIVFSVTLLNSGPVAADDVGVDFYVDGSYIGSKSAAVPASGTAAVSYEWAVASLRGGAHELTAIIDRTSELVEFTTGDNVLVRTFYIQSEQNLIGSILTPIVALLAAMLVLLLLRKPGRRPRGAKPL